jgi:hypothetical protein
VQTHTTASSNGNSKKQKASATESLTSNSCKQNMPVPSFLKALYISSWDTIFDDDYADQQIVSLSAGHSNTTSRNANSVNNNSRGNFRSPHNILPAPRQDPSQSTSLSAPEALKLRMHELTARSKSALGLTPSNADYTQNQQSPNFNNQGQS